MKALRDASSHPGAAFFRRQLEMQALAAFERSLPLNPGRYRATAGAARAPERVGRTEIARDHYRKLLDLARDGDGQRPETAQAKAFLDHETGVGGVEDVVPAQSHGHHP